MYGNVDWISADYDDKVGDGLYEKNWSTCSEKHLHIDQRTVLGINHNREGRLFDTIKFKMYETKDSGIFLNVGASII